MINVFGLMTMLEFYLLNPCLKIWYYIFTCSDRFLLQAMCTEAGLMALRERRMKITAEDFTKAKETVLYRKMEKTPEGLYL